MTTAVVLFSGGQDSTTCLYWARTMFDRVLALTVYYGQRHRSEVDAALEIAELAGVEHDVVELPEYGALVGRSSSLIDAAVAQVEQPDLASSGGMVDAAMPEGLPTTFVPGRNALLLTLAAAYGTSRGTRDVVTGVCQTDYSGYPDCRSEFVEGMAVALSLALPSSMRPVRIHTPLMNMTKAETVRLAERLPGCWTALAHSVTCYRGERPGCNECPACILRARGFAEAGELDPARHIEPGRVA